MHESEAASTFSFDTREGRVDKKKECLRFSYKPNASTLTDKRLQKLSSGK